MTNTMTEEVAREVIRERTAHRHLQPRPSHARTSRILRTLARRLDLG